MPTVPVVGVGKDGRTVIGAWGYLNRKLSFIELPLRTVGPVPDGFSVVNAIGTQLIAWPDDTRH